MSAVFTQSVTQRLSQASAAVDGNSAFWMASWMKPTANTNNQTVIGLGSTTGTHAYGICPFGDTQLYIKADGSVGATGNAASIYAANAWQLVVAVIASTSSRTVYLGSTPGTTNTTTVTFSDLNRTTIGGLLYDIGQFFGFIGKIGEPTIWTGSPSGGSIASLAGGADPATIDAGNIVFHESLYSGAGALTNTGSVTFDTADHPITVSGTTFRRRSVCIGL